MSKEKKPSIARIFLRRAARGGTKLIPLVGPLFEEMSFGTLDEVAKAEETAKLNVALDSILSTAE